ncbi:MAG: 50S ribosomal protein L13 [Candidatus Omnitrophota bacterium]|nr:50S ribosomal protein L13 [Candidatus Omnitrophota bacterium]MBU1929425.1 50S ribosomal protein L13 [Candidatus Omnitrophota bacterium]MBU2034853.1 50S ribosomal protein L13 [Candidatus Omnitrophota bacterium]
MQKTYMPKKEDIKVKWYLVDAEGQILGRLASQVARILKGKHKAIYSPHINTGDAVVVINAAKIKVTGRKLKQKVYRRYSGYQGGLREVYLETMLAKKPATVIQLAVRRMLPKGALAEDMFGKLHVYADEKHGHAAQKPELLKLK